MTNQEAMEILLRRGLKEGIVTPEQVALSLQFPGTFIGANGFVGRECKFCCGPDKPRGNVVIPVQEMYSLDVCHICQEQLAACGEGRGTVKDRKGYPEVGRNLFDIQPMPKGVKEVFMPPETCKHGIVNPQGCVLCGHGFPYDGWDKCPEWLQRKVVHLVDQVGKRQWMNALCVLSEMFTGALREFNQVLKDRVE